MLEQLAKDPWFLAVGTFQLVASLCALIFLIARWRRNGVLLSYEPRRPVPWSAAGALPAVAFAALAVAAAVAIDDTTRPLAKPGSQDVILSLAASTVMQSLGPILLLFVAATCQARWSDIGLPSRSAAAWTRDAAIGAVACLAAIVPVGLVNAAARMALNLPDELTKHPLVEMLTRSEPEVFVLALATVMAVVVAPIGEEITFRLLLQGWLEKWEDRRLGWRNRAQTPPDAVMQFEVAVKTQPPALDEDLVELVPLTTAPPAAGVFGLPYGWTPIIVSAALFAVAHVGYGPEPAPLFVLALALGYCYQRTHRILPCIVAHGLFNLLSMIALWRVVLINAS
jgi:membrane protease YdiL (CAAX protease family)